MGMNIVDLILKIAVVIALIIVRLYWHVSEQEADLRRPSTITKRTKFRNYARIIEIIFYVTLLIQIFVYNFLPFNPTFVTRLIGIFFFAAGIRLSVAGRQALGENWNHMIDYQIKQKQQLVTDGIFKYVRHPIYGGFLLMMVGVEIILHSWLFILVAITIFPFIYLQSKKEESILARHFHKEYLSYMHRTKMFFPFIF